MRVKVFSLAATFLFLPAGIAFGIPINTFSQIVAFGDSLSDAGNASIATLGIVPGANYATRSVPDVPLPVGYFTDGTNTTPSTAAPTGLWIDQLAAKMGLKDPVPTLAPGGGTNYAVGLAMTGSANPQDMQNQVNLFLAEHPGSASNSALYVFWGGANDLFFGAGSVSGKQAADNIFSEIQQVAADGGKYFLWLNLPPLGDTPLGASNGASSSAALNAQSSAFNTEWQTDLNQLNSAGIYAIGVDVSSLVNQVIANPSAYGFSNVTTPCQGNSSINPNTCLFWDDEHPTTEADMYVANAALSDLQAAPEPSSIGLLFLGGCGLLAFRKMRSKPVRRG